MSTKDIHDITVDELIKTAFSKNNRISEDEFKILHQVSNDADVYAELFNQFNNKGTITKQEGRILKTCKIDMLENAKKLTYNGRLSKQKETLYNKLARVIAIRYKNY